MADPPINLAPKPGESSPAPASAVFPAARKASGTMTADPRARLERIVTQLVEAALSAYRDAATARAEGDVMGAGLLQDAARRALDTAHETIEEIEGLATA